MTRYSSHSRRTPSTGLNLHKQNLTPAQTGVASKPASATVGQGETIEIRHPEPLPIPCESMTITEAEVLGGAVQAPIAVRYADLSCWFWRLGPLPHRHALILSKFPGTHTEQIQRATCRWTALPSQHTNDQALPSCRSGRVGRGPRPARRRSRQRGHSFEGGDRERRSRHEG